MEPSQNACLTSVIKTVFGFQSSYDNQIQWCMELQHWWIGDRAVTGACWPMSHWVVEPSPNWCIHNTTALPEAWGSFQKRDQKDRKIRRNGKEVCCEIVSPKYIRNCTPEVLHRDSWHRSCTRMTPTDTVMWKRAGSSWNFQYKKNHRQLRNACSRRNSLSHGKARQSVFNNRCSSLKAYT